MILTTRLLLWGLVMNIKQIQENCPYCHGTSENGGDGKALVFDDADTGIAHINGRILWIGSQCGECDGCYIRFCPMCGRRLTRRN